MTDLCKITILTPCRNAVATIEDTMRSVSAQDYDRLEYIIIDADSDDGTSEVIEKYRDKVSLWIREPDNGVADAWNKGIRAASGDIIGILNADDRYIPGTVASVVDAFFKEKNSGFVYGDLRIEKEDSTFSHTEKGRPGYEAATRYDMLHVPHPTVFLRKAVYDAVGLYDTTYRIASDYEFIRRMASKEVCGTYIPQTLAIMRQGGLSHTQRTLAFREVRDISVTYGANALVAASYLYFKLTRNRTGILCDKLGIDAGARRKARLLARRLASKTA